MVTLSHYAKRLLITLIPSLSLFYAASAAKIAASQQRAVEDALGMVLGFLCPAKDVLHCPTLDFITAFGLVFFTFWLGISLVPQFKDAGDSSKTAIIGIDLFAGLGTAFYVSIQKIPFLAFIAPFGLFIVATVLGLIVVQVLFAAREGETTWAHKMLMAGLVMIIAGIAMAYFNPENLGWWAMLGFGGFMLLLIGGIMLARGAGGGGGGGGLFGLGRRTETPAQEAQEEAGEERAEAEEAAAEPGIQAAVAGRTNRQQNEELFNRLLGELEQELRGLG